MESDTPKTTDGAPCKCPHCGGNIGINLIARARAESRIVFKVEPAPGELLTAKNVGAAIKSFGDMMRSLGKDMDIPTEVLVEKVETSDQGVLSIHCLIARWQDHHHSAANREARHKEHARVE